MAPGQFLLSGLTSEQRPRPHTPLKLIAAERVCLPMWSQSAPSLIMRVHSPVRFPKSDARTEGEMMLHETTEKATPSACAQRQSRSDPEHEIG